VKTAFMKALLLGFCAFLLICGAQAQVTSIKLTDKTVVKDSAGKLYPYVEWVNLFNKGHVLTPLNPKDPSTEFLITILSEQQLKDKLEKAPKPNESSYFTTGQDIKLFKANDMQGRMVNLEDSIGKIIVLNFWFINCGPCRKEIPELNELVDSFANTGKVLFYGVALDQKADLGKFLPKFPFKYNIIDDGRSIAAQYGIRSYPTHAIVDTNGKIYFHTVGLAYNTVYWLRKSIIELLEKE
jgi:thiol-disulfide isomerase/thioredoxin